MPPTTGSAVDMAVLAALAVTASAAPVTAPLMPSQAVKPVITSAVARPANFEMSFEAPSSAGLSSAAEAVRTPMLT